MKSYDIIIVGAGPAGLFSALKLCDSNNKIALIDQGPDLDKRILDRNKAGLSGFGGSGGGINDGKLIFSLETGGNLNKIISEKQLNKHLIETKKIWKSFIGDIEIDNFDNLAENKDIVDKAKSFDLNLIVSDIIHIGSDLLPFVLEKIRAYLIEKNVDLLMNTEITDIHSPNRIDTYFKVNTINSVIRAKKVILAPGRGGAKWLQKQCLGLGIKNDVGFVDIGVRVEVPFNITQYLTDRLYEFKIKYITHSFKDQVRTFCCNPKGIVVKEEHKNFTLVNGYSNKDKNSPNTNFAFLSSIQLTTPNSNPLEFSENIAKTVNSISNGGVMVQTLEDLLSFRRTKTLKGNKVSPTLLEASPGDINLVFPYRFVKNITEGLQALNNFIPGIYHGSTLLYAPENKLYSSIIQTDNNMQTPIEGLYVIGDGGGATRSLVHASISGLIAAEHILKL